MPKIIIKDAEFEVSTVVKTAILAERTDKDREIKTLKDAVKDKNKEFDSLSDSLTKTKKQLNKIERKALRDSVIAKIIKVDDSFKSKEKNPIVLMADYAEIKDKDKRKDSAYVVSYFNSVIDAKIVSLNDTVTKKRKKNKDKEIVIPKKYLKGK